MTAMSSALSQTNIKFYGHHDVVLQLANFDITFCYPKQHGLAAICSMQTSKNGCCTVFKKRYLF
jgi:hypothetical protein